MTLELSVLAPTFVVAVASLVAIVISVRTEIVNRRTLRMLEGRLTRKQARIVAEAAAANERRRAEHAAWAAEVRSGSRTSDA